MTRPPMLAADHIRELTQRHNTITVITRDNGDTEYHNVPQPPLLEQLAHATDNNGVSDEGGGLSVFGSKPPAHLGAIDALDRIDHQARVMARELNIQAHGPLTEVLHRISGQIGDQPNHKIRSWWTTARLLSHHDAKPYRPRDAPCPTCWETNTIRIRLDEEVAGCIECGDVWDRTGDPEHGSLDVLGNHIKWCTDHEVTKARHWLTDTAGFPTECVECLPFRQARAEWKTNTPTR